jgi:predicted transglutaminase-like cysteine proteinase
MNLKIERAPVDQPAT